MKILLIASLILISSNTVLSQNTEINKLQKIKDLLIIKKTEITDSIENLNVRINYLISRNGNLNEGNVSYTETTTQSEAKVKNKPDVFGDIIGYISPKKTIKVYEYLNSYWLIEKDSIKGYVSEIYLVHNQQMNKIKKIFLNKKITEKYGEFIANKIFNRRIWIGMTTDVTRLSIGSPIKINHSTGSWGKNEQWVYQNKYLYFENGKLTSWQTSEN